MARDQHSQTAATTKRSEGERAPQPVASRWGQFVRSEWLVAVAVLALYGLLLLRLPGANGDPRDFVLIGSKFIDRPGPSSVITPDPAYHYTVTGYDGQFCYYIALDPINARYYIDVPAYRYTRILYPITARLLALGQPTLIPYTLIALNWLAIGGGTLAVAAWLRRKGRSPWFALVYGCYPGMLIALQRDLTEPLAYALVALAVYLFDFGGRYRLLWAGIGFALAALARETAALFAIVYALALLLEAGSGEGWRARLAANWRRATLLLGLALGPLLLYKGFLLLWLGSLGLPSDLSVQVLPFRGILVLWPWQTNQIAALLCIIAPAMLCAGVGVWALWKRAAGIEVWALLANVLLFVVLLAPPPYIEIFGSERVTMGVVLAACYCLPTFDRLTNRRRWWFWGSTALWQALLPVLVILTSLR